MSSSIFICLHNGPISAKATVAATKDVLLENDSRKQPTFADRRLIGADYTRKRSAHKGMFDRGGFFFLLARSRRKRTTPLRASLSIDLVVCDQNPVLDECFLDDLVIMQPQAPEA